MWILFMQLVDMFVVVLPVLHKTGFGFMDVFFSLFPAGWNWRHSRLAVPTESFFQLSFPD